ncbi:FABP5-like protein [Mya arenaria]|uniref:FABP5-like protein n=1 Tax=Mya arenaria TaxID=6604 RepID=A0ABY7GAZ1_MYAAR|nr:fatty acid-binding protein 10-A, liver basic-like isoform X2 [Mya arenaria]XP_052789477.1 fatty acid-binding protein 10-A, liver basic-like isoform X2 [Mya arenaria]WAR31582.1 FABP5-like protein [Mya arenaria]
MSGAEAFMGSWREEEKEGYEEMVTALGLPEENKEFFKNARTKITCRRDGDVWEIDVGMHGVPHTRTFRFKPGEQYELASLDGSPMKSVVTVDGDKLQEKHIDDNLHGMDMNITRYIDGEKMIVETQVGELRMRSIYARI